MSKMRSSIIIGAVFIKALILAPSASAGDTTGENFEKMACNECHTCSNPTAGDPCLKLCPTHTWAQTASRHKLAEAPDSMLLNKLVNEYNPVHFYHKLHAQMSGMGKGCQTCHHYSPPGHIPPCTQCHGGEANPANLNQPSLKGAYHRQCLSCHREWSHDTKCYLCHSPLDEKSAIDAGYDSTDIMGISHPIITVPNKKVYYTPYKPGTIVTFYHQEHIDLFGLRCVDCHQKENCGYCHDASKPTKLAKSMEEIHGVCSGCHGNDRCVKCHGGSEKPAFAHATTGWKLNRFHAELVCRACHPTGKKISRLATDCVSCHSGWNRENFEHVIAGLQLDEVHAELDCSDCHMDKKFESRPECSSCHDDGRTYEKNPPGKFVKLSQK